MVSSHAVLSMSVSSFLRLIIILDLLADLVSIFILMVEVWPWPSSLQGVGAALLSPATLWDEPEYKDLH